MTTPKFNLVYKNLKERIISGAEQSDELSLKTLAARYSVSYTPVKLAIKALVMENLLIKQPDGRVRTKYAEPVKAKSEKPAKIPVPDIVPDWEKKLLHETVLLSMQCSPKYLREKKTVQKYGVCREQIRHAFSRLIGRGMLQSIRNQGFRVQPFSEEDMSSYFAAWESLELTALKLAVPNLVRADLEAMLEANSSEYPHNSPQWNNDLHQYLIQKSGNRCIQEFFYQFGPYYTALFNYANPDFSAIQVITEHRRVIITAMLEQDWEMAGRAISNHIRAQRPMVNQLMEKIKKETAPNA